MDSLQGLRIEIVSDGKGLDLYDDPDVADESVNPYARTLYVEAITGATFSVRVTFTKDFQYFNLGYSDAVSLEVHYDGSGGTKTLISGRRCRQRSADGRQDFAEMISTTWSFCRTSQQWSVGNPCFGDLIIGEYHQSVIPTSFPGV